MPGRRKKIIKFTGRRITSNPENFFKKYFQHCSIIRIFSVLYSESKNISIDFCISKGEKDMKFYGKIFCAFLAALTLSASAPAFAADTPAESAPGEIKLYADSERTKELTSSPEAGQTVYASVVCREGYYPYSLTVDCGITEDGGIVIPENGKLSASAQLVLAGDIAVDGKLDMKDLVVMMQHAVEGYIPWNTRFSLRSDFDVVAGNYDRRESFGVNYRCSPIDTKDIIHVSRILAGWKNELYPEKEYPIAAEIQSTDYAVTVKATRGERISDRIDAIKSVEAFNDFFSNFDTAGDPFDKPGFEGYSEEYGDELRWNAEEMTAEYNEEFFADHMLVIYTESDYADGCNKDVYNVYRKNGVPTLEFHDPYSGVRGGDIVVFHHLIELPKDFASAYEDWNMWIYDSKDYLHTHDVALNIGE